nr:hypothetical protein [Marinicella sp. W31]MDC2878713.1 hypothetical protein [Marinicella sp. W31]
MRDKNQIVASGWWTSLSTSTQNVIYRTPGEAGQTQEGDLYINTGNALEGSAGEVSRFGISSLRPEEFEIGQTVDLDDGMQLTVEESGDYRLTSPEPFGRRGERIFVTAEIPRVSRLRTTATF